MRGLTGVHLVYVVRHKLKGPNDFVMTSMGDSSFFEKGGSIYLPINDELIAWALILSCTLTVYQQLQASRPLSLKNPLTPASLLTWTNFTWGKSGWWRYVKKCRMTKNGCKVYQTLHTMLLRGPQVVSMGSAIIAKLQLFRYVGDRKNFNFDKFIYLHVEQHNQYADLQEYWIAPLPESKKILWFQDSINDLSLDAVKASINANKSNFEDFDSVKNTYIDFKCTQPPTENLWVQQVASFARGGSSSPSHQNGCGQGPRTGNACQKGLIPQSEIDRMTHIVLMLKDYTPDEYRILTPTEKQKLWQLRSPGKTPGTEPARCDHSATSVASTLTA
jgi:hypothetical protein